MQGLEKINNTAVYAVEAETMEEINEAHKRKGADYDPYLKSFIQGSGGQITVWDQISDSMVPIVLSGVTKKKYMAACQAIGRDYYYIDTGYFGNERKKFYHRITKNAMQNLGPVVSRPRDRLAATGYQSRKFRGGSNILLAPPSQKLLAVYDINLEDWIQQTIDKLQQFTDREILIREKAGRRARTTTDTMEMALDNDIHCLVTFSSIAAVEAVLLGKPAIVLGPSAAHSVCSHDCSDIETPFIPTLDEVEEWAAHLAYCQFTEVEMRDGTAWRILNENA
jgi:DNA-binding Lrp family transcriptional regulator